MKKTSIHEEVIIMTSSFFILVCGLSPLGIAIFKLFPNAYKVLFILTLIFFTIHFVLAIVDLSLNIQIKRGFYHAVRNDNITRNDTFGGYSYWYQFNRYQFKFGKKDYQILVYTGRVIYNLKVNRTIYEELLLKLM